MAGRFSLTVILLMCLISLQQLDAQIAPIGRLALRPGGYVMAKHQDVFDDLSPHGLTIEAWVYLTDLPREGKEQELERWVILAKPGGYEIIIRGRDIGSEQETPKGTVFVEYRVYQQPQPNNVGRSVIIIPIRPAESPLNRWIHLALQLREVDGLTEYVTFVGSKKPWVKSSNNPPMGRLNTPLLIGGPKQVKLNAWFEWGVGDSSPKGFIDEVRISNRERYPDGLPEAEIQPPRRFLPDIHTVALWHFDEAPGATRYNDASGNGYTLFAGGSLPVEVQGKLAATWSKIKQDTR